MSRALNVTESRLVETATKHTAARRKWPERNARKIINCGGKDVYLASMELLGGAFPRLSSSKGTNRHSIRFKMTQTGSKKVAKLVGR
jgi:hypothetical protein